jgi:uncharacterized protein (TIGR02246 family)
MPRRHSLAPILLLLAAFSASACGTPRQAASSPDPVSDSLARRRGTLTIAGDRGGFPAPVPILPGAREAVAAIRAVLDAQVTAWNAGDVRGFMAGYAGTDSLMFVSNGQRQVGWQDALYAYVRNYPDRASMGTLSFEDLDVDVLGRDVALVTGLFRIRREGAEQSIGLFSLVFRKEDDGAWRIIHDHTSTSP